LTVYSFLFSQSIEIILISGNKNKSQKFEIFSELTKEYRRFNKVGTQLKMRLNPPTSETDRVNRFIASVNDLFEHALQNVSDGDVVGISIRNVENQNYNPIGIGFRWKDQITGDVICSVFEKVARSNFRFNALEKLVVLVHSVRMSVRFGRF